jgi:1,4-dihydroxy-2-naphthoate polyprenyltransferase
MPAIILAGVPDYEADRAVGKSTIAVRIGRKGAIALSLVFALATAVSALLVGHHPAGSALYGAGLVLLILYGAWLSFLLGRRLRYFDKVAGYNALIATGLGYTALVAVIPFAALVQASERLATAGL